MNARCFKHATYMPPGGIEAATELGQEKWDEYLRQQRVQRASIKDTPEDPRHESSPGPRTRADSHQSATTTPRTHRSVDASHTERIHSAALPAQLRSSHGDERLSRCSGANYGYVGNRLSPQVSPSNPHGEIRRLSGNFNAPTEVELERDREFRKSLKGMEKLRTKVKGWVRA